MASSAKTTLDQSGVNLEPRSLVDISPSEIVRRHSTARSGLHVETVQVMRHAPFQWIPGSLPSADCFSSLLKKPSQRPTVDDSIIYHESSGARMRGAFADQGGLFSYISGGAGASQPSSAEDPSAGLGCLE
jgi:hypothetical protein